MTSWSGVCVECGGPCAARPFGRCRQCAWESMRKPDPKIKFDAMGHDLPATWSAGCRCGQCCRAEADRRMIESRLRRIIEMQS